MALAAIACQQPTKQTTDPSVLSHIDSIFLSAPDFSGVVLLADNGEPIYHKAFGYKDFRNRIPLDTGDVFELASVSKQFTAMVIMMLEEEGLLQYDDPMEKYLPDLPYPGITIRHLLNHTSGLPNYQAVMDQHWDKSKVAGNEDNIAYLIQYHPERRFAPGEKYEYSNTGYMLLASIAEKASGMDFIELSRERIYKRLKMHKSDIRTIDDKKKRDDMAWGHRYVKEKDRYVQADSFPSSNYGIWLGNRKGPGRMSGSASDLLKWDQALYGNELVSPATLEAAFSPATLNDGTPSNYGFGWRIGSHKTLGKVVNHSGANPGYRTIILRYIEARKTLIVLCNNEHRQFNDIVKALTAALAREKREGIAAAEAGL